MNLKEAYGGKLFNQHNGNTIQRIDVPTNRAPELKKPEPEQQVVQTTVVPKVQRKPKTHVKKTSPKKSVLQKLGAAFAAEEDEYQIARPVYLVQLELAQDDCHLICMFLLIFILSVLLSRNK